MWVERTEELKLLYRLSAELRITSSRPGLPASEQARLRDTAQALQKAIAALESQIHA